LLETSALHAFVDVWAVLTEEPTTALLDAAAYPLGRMALCANGRTVRHFDPGHVAEVLHDVPRGTRPVLLVDGLCPGCGRLAPLGDLVEVLALRHGVVLVDDTQALGLAGTGPSGRSPYGAGGGGSARRLAVPSGAPLVVVASAAKGLGVPLAVLAGPAELVGAVRARGPSRVHASGPSSAAQAALAHALATDLDPRRQVLADLVRLFRSGLRRHGLPADGGSWPTQTVPSDKSLEARDELAREGIHTVVTRRRCRRGHGVTFLINSHHTPDDIDQAVHALAKVLP
jgi:8-amino-7-oxononanoate synthase